MKIYGIVKETDKGDRWVIAIYDTRQDAEHALNNSIGFTEQFKKFSKNPAFIEEIDISEED